MRRVALWALLAAKLIGGLGPGLGHSLAPGGRTRLVLDPAARALFRLPAFAHMLPSPSAAAALALTVGLSLAGSACAARLARPLGLDG